ncbi:aspartyl protease family protein At5g10770-like [Aegilops tauschii subsp. strangulata]|uniref:aspartyl protease family protein At5g10770-like n=1 Tax=Aegilops tauschii subsp. strangulata TaxID=200361 RepID=UPI00098BCDE4|nr:aspartyl protease family protein At5g10770-like [Aegilops tauschii subsp. strangulata]XP_044416733.1 aspartyl protease family protein At5g10770-like [Triticum aestivum]
MEFVDVSQLLLLLSCILCLIASAAVKPQAVCPSAKVLIPSSSSGGGATVALNHRHGPCSPLPTKEAPTLEDLLRRDKVRAAYVQRRLGGIQQSEVSVPTELGYTVGTLEYLITVGLGSPAVQQTVIVDTASDVSWVHWRTSGGYDPSKSTTYAAISCSSAECSQLGEAGNGCMSSDCQYVVHYSDGSSTAGTYGSDTLALAGSGSGSATVVSNFQFGCSRDETGFDDLTDGLMGLSGFLTLGAPSNTSGFATTRMVGSEAEATFYFVVLQGIIVAGNQLSLPPTVFSAGTFMDSGTVVTRLPPTAYQALSSAFKANMTQYPAAPPRSLMDTCFDLAGQEKVMIPSVALVFDGGAVVYLDANGIMLENCLAFAPIDDDGMHDIIGNVQQRTFEVLYGVGQGVVGFRPNAC